MSIRARRRSVPSGARWGTRIDTSARFAVAIGIAAGISGAILIALPRKLHAYTDVVGSTTFANFDVDFYFDVFYVAVIVFPLTALALFVAVTWAARRIGWVPSSTARRAGNELANNNVGPASKNYVGQALRLAAVGSVLGLEAAITHGNQAAGVWKAMAIVSIGYAIAAIAVAAGWRFLRHSRRPMVTLVGSVNSLASPSVVVGLFAVSSATQLTVLHSGTIHHYPWLPAWLAASAAVGAAAAITIAVARARTNEDIAEVERMALLVIVGAVGLFLVVATIPGELGRMDMFHEGESLVPGRLAALGYFPWRDIIWAHGLLEDTYRSLPGTNLFDNSRWGAVAGFELILSPLYLVFLYALFVYLFRRSWPFLLVAALFILSRYFGGGLFRFLLWPVVLLLLAAMLQKQSTVRTVVLVLAVGVQAIITPESVYAVPACGAVILGYEVYHFNRDRGFVANFQRTITGGVTAMAFAGAFALYLVSQHAFGDFLFYYHVASEGRNYQGALSFRQVLRDSGHPLVDLFAALTSPAVLLISFWYAIDHLRRKVPFSTPDWVMGAVAIFVLLYYQKFLTRADHIYHPYTMAVPLMLYIAYRLLAWVEGGIARWKWGANLTRTISRHPVSLLLLVGVAVAIPGNLPTLVGQAPARYRALAANEPWLARLGYATPDALDRGAYGAINNVMHAYLGPSDTVFDFSNEPGLYYYLMENRPPSRYYHVVLAMPMDVQEDLVRRLKSSRPKLVVFTNDQYGLPSWDYIPSQVRHYEISQYILDNYHPLLDVHSQLILIENGVSVPSPNALGLEVKPSTENSLYFDAPACDWGYTPNFFSVTPIERHGGVSLPLSKPFSGTQPLILTLPPGLRWTDFRWIEIQTGDHFLDDTFVLSDGSPELRHHVTFKTLPDSGGIYRVRVGNCIQWHGYRDTSLQLTHGRPQDITAIRLLP